MARVHFNVSNTGSYDCEESGNAEGLVITCEAQGMNNESCPEEESTFLSRGPILNIVNEQVLLGEVSYLSWPCELYGAIPQPRIKFTQEKSVLEPILVKNGVNLYSIEQVDEVITTYQVYSLSGQQMEVRMINNTFSLEGLAPGMYIIRYEALNKSYSEKLMVQE